MKKQNSRRIMIDAIAKVTAVAIVVALVAGVGFIIKSWDKVMPMDNPFEAEQEYRTEVIPETEEPKPSEPPVENTSNTENTETPTVDETQPEVPQRNEETNETQVTNDEDSAYNKETAQLIVTIATEQLGTPYKSGGDSPDEGFDSTGFTYYCVNEAGVKFPRNLKDQLKSGEWVAFNELAAGDIVYFSQEVGGGATFCGVYVGGGLIIYSPVPDDFVKTANITTNYWTTHFVTGLRLTSQTSE
ncbi:MAG: C40 family peptidase [Oscillospiraceae bacterium]|nr:C40 family peptidase [Oscillospiraceae bacterium]